MECAFAGVVPLSGVTKAFWGLVDEAAFALIYGAVMVLSILMAIEAPPEQPFRTAIALFGSVFAIVLAHTFAEFLAYGIKTGNRLSGVVWQRAWRRSRASLIAANIPALCFVAASLGWLTVEGAVLFAQGYCVGLLLFIGARAGWVIQRRALLAILSAMFVGGVGATLALLKFLIQ
jgi:hypothetical protein